LLVAITGGLASGKSTVARYFGALGARVIESDLIVRNLLTDLAIQEQLVTILGREIMVGDGELSHQRMAQAIFGDPEKKRLVEALLHPLVYNEIGCVARELSAGEVLVAEVPLLYESHGEHLFDAVVCVDVPSELAKERYCLAGGAEEQFELRERAQISRAEKIARANYVIINDGSPEELWQKTKDLYYQLTQPKS